MRMSAANSASGITDVGDASRTMVVASTAALDAIGLVNDETDGIVIGTGTTAVDITDSKLVAKIAHGVGAGQMVHQAQTWPAGVTTADPDVTFATNRNFNNNSGGGITVGETGIQFRQGITGSTTADFLAIRDTPTALLVPDGGGCNVSYTLKITE